MTTSYIAGKWTPKTLETLNYIEAENNKGIRPKPKDLESGTIRNWAYVLKNSGHLENGKGFLLTEKGKILLQELRENPPEGRRRKVLIGKKGRKKSVTTAISDTDTYNITIEGNKTYFEQDVSTQKALEIIKSLMESKK